MRTTSSARSRTYRSARLLRRRLRVPTPVLRTLLQLRLQRGSLLRELCTLLLEQCGCLGLLLLKHGCLPSVWGVADF